MTTTAAASSAAASSAIPFKPAAPLEANALGDGWIALVVCMAVLAIVVTLLRRRAIGLPRLGSTPRAVSVVESTRLGERTRLSVVRYRGRELLVAHGDHAPTVLADQAVAPSEEPKP